MQAATTMGAAAGSVWGGKKDQRLANPKKKATNNVSGPFFVDTSCIDCDLCLHTAPNHFVRNDDEGYSYVMKQPETEDEWQRCLEALNDCPVEAIGGHGDEAE